MLPTFTKKSLDLLILFSHFCTRKYTNSLTKKQSASVHLFALSKFFSFTFFCLLSQTYCNHSHVNGPNFKCRHTLPPTQLRFPSQNLDRQARGDTTQRLHSVSVYGCQLVCHLSVSKLTLPPHNHAPMQLGGGRGN